MRGEQAGQALERVCVDKTAIGKDRYARCPPVDRGRTRRPTPIRHLHDRERGRDLQR